MNKLIKIALGAALPALWAAGCSDFLKGGELSNNPNQPATGSASNGQLFISIQANNFVYQESDMGRAVAQWMQQLVGVQRQQVTIYDYTGITNATYDGVFQLPYLGGGLIDLRVLEAQTGGASVPDLVYLGVAQVIEAWMIGQTADVWGDIPYTQAVKFVTYPTPALDPQQTVYDSVEALLSRAITNLAGSGGGPGGVDLVYGGSVAKWTALAHTLKARFYLHQEEKLGTSMYTSALAEANLGILLNTGDYIAFHVHGLQYSSNTWWQFMDANGGTGRAGDLVASSKGVVSPQVDSKLWTMMKVAGDTRWTLYFDSTNAGGGNMSAVRLSDNFPQPFVTANENDLIIAEAQAGLGNGAAATTALNAEQARWNTAAPWHAARLVPATAGTLANIMTEKYILMFQNTEAWNDWKRTCIPSLTPVTSLPQFGNTVPSRMFYGATEQQSNPNIPAVGTGSNGAFNWNDPVKCP